MLKKITLTYAQSLDGKIATIRGDSRYISEEGSLELNQKMREEHDAILVGIGTVLADNPLLTCRINDDSNPVRVILDSSLKLPLDSRIAETSKDVKTIVFYNNAFLGSEDSNSFKNRIAQLKKLQFSPIGVSAETNGSLCLTDVLEALNDAGVESLMVEGGSSVLTSFLKAKLWDEMVVVTAVKIFGSGIPAFSNIGVESLSDAVLPEVRKITVLGNEVCWHLIKPAKHENIKTRTVFFSAPGKIEVQNETLKTSKNGERLFKSRIMAISPGTEKKIYLGKFQKDKIADPSIDCIENDFTYPFTYGYINIIENEDRKRFFGFLPHTERLYAAEESLFPLTKNINDDSALFIPHLETAISIIHDSNPKLGDRVLITGAGVIGTLTSRILKEIMGIENIIYDINPEKGIWFPEDNFCGVHEDIARLGPFDICIEASGTPSGLQTCMENSNINGKITVASWYGEEDILLNLGTSFHWKRLQLISSQVSNMKPSMGKNWNKSRRLNLAAEFTTKIKTNDLLTHKFPVSKADLAYKMFESDETLYGLIALIPGG